MFTRDIIQGFIDGYIYSGGDPESIGQAISDYLGNHPTYKASAEESQAIANDVQSYRVTSTLTAVSILEAKNAAL